MGRKRKCREGCAIAKVRATFEFIFKLFRTLLNNMKEAQASEELVGVVHGSVIEAKGKKERVVQAFKLSSVCHTIHKWKGTNAERDMQQRMDLGQENMYE